MDLSRRYYRKEITSVPFFAAGARVMFEQLAGNTGVLAVEDTEQNKSFILALDEAAKKRVGGVVMIDAEQYEDLKKKRPYDPSANRSRDESIRIMPTGSSPLKHTMKSGLNAEGVVAPDVDREAAVADLQSSPPPAPKASPTPAATAPVKPATTKTQMSFSPNVGKATETVSPTEKE
jgi:hypothetical protein